MPSHPWVVPRPPEQTKRNALSFVRHTLEEHPGSERHRDLTVHYAHTVGCSLQEIAKATGIPETAVGQAVERVASGHPAGDPIQPPRTTPLLPARQQRIWLDLAGYKMWWRRSRWMMAL